MPIFQAFVYADGEIEIKSVESHEPEEATCEVTVFEEEELEEDELEEAISPKERGSNNTEADSQPEQKTATASDIVIESDCCDNTDIKDENLD